MGRVTFEGPVKSNGGFEVGTAGSRSGVAGTLVITSGGSMTVASIQMAPLTSGTITIGTAVTGWNNTYQDLGTLGGAASTAASVSMNMALGSSFYMSWNGAIGATIMPVGGYMGQDITLMVKNNTVSALILASSSSVQIMAGGEVAVGSWTGAAILPGSTAAITFKNIGPGLATPTTSNVLIVTQFIGNVSQTFL